MHDRAATVRLAGEFHLLMAQMVGNEMILRQLQELIGRSTALVTFFEPESAATCTCEEHGLVLEAVAKRDSAAAVRAMTSHLSLIETRLRPRICESPRHRAGTGDRRGIAAVPCGKGFGPAGFVTIFAFPKRQSARRHTGQ